jgi:hypothetical protein
MFTGRVATNVREFFVHLVLTRRSGLSRASSGEADVKATVPIMAVTCGDWLLAARAGWHAARPYQHLTTSQTPHA